jgi:hypothetical protein
MPDVNVLFHGTVILLIGLLDGFPFMRGIVGSAEPRRVEAWRAAHTGLCGTGVMIIAMGATLRLWGARGPMRDLAAIAIVIGGYALTLAMTLAAASGSRGLVAGGALSNRVVYITYMTGVPATLVGTLAFLWLAWHHAT